MNDNVGRIGDNVRIHANVRVGANVTIGDNSIIYDNVVIGDGTFIGPDCILGEPVAAFYEQGPYENPKLEIGENSLVRSHSILYAGSTFGEGFETGHRVTIRERSEFGAHCKVGTLSDIQGFVKIGDYCRFHSSVFVAQRSTIMDYVWILPHAVLANDPHPPSDCIEGPTIEDYAVISAGAVIMPRVRVGKDAVVGARALVTRDVPEATVVAGAPARVLRSVYDVVCKEGKVARPYPWRHNYSKGYPWHVDAGPEAAPAEEPGGER